MTVEAPPERVDRDAAIMAFIEQFWRDRGYGPSVREIMVGCGLHSPASTHYHLVLLHQRGRLSIAWQGRQMIARTWRIAPQTPD